MERVGKEGVITVQVLKLPAQQRVLAVFMAAVVPAAGRRPLGSAALAAGTARFPMYVKLLSVQSAHK